VRIFHLLKITLRGKSVLIKLIRTIFTACAIFSASLLQAETFDLTVESRDSIDLAIYNENLALVNDVYAVRLPAGQSELNFSAVSPLIDFNSAVLHPLPESLSVLSQYFREAMTPEAILINSVGQLVSLVRTHPVSGEQTLERARILSASGGLILEIDGRFETSLAGRRIVYDTLPSGVFRPTLNVGVDSAVDAQSRLVLSYLTGGLSWQANYVVQLNESRDAVQLRAMASIGNHSGVDFREAKIELIAGSINRVQNHRVARRTLSSAVMMDSESSISPVPLADLYTYSLPRTVDLANTSTRQVKLFEARDVPAEQLYLLAGQSNVYYSPNVPEQKLKVDSYIEFANALDHHLGIPMPAGVVRVYAQNSSQTDSFRFIGEDQVGHIPAGDRVRLKTGKAFDLGGARTQLAYRRLPVEAPFRQHNEARIQIVLSNAKQTPVTIQVQEIFSGEWMLIDGPKPFESDAHSARWNILVPAQGEASLDLTVRVKR
jgi:hypothetical protein